MEQLASDKTWRWSASAPEGWTTPNFNDSAWKPAAELGDAKAAPWRLDEKLSAGAAQVTATAEVRSSLCTADPLTTALGRTNREQVTTERQSVATTLQALELSNGQTLTEILQRGAAKLASDPKRSPRQVVELIYARAFGRKPMEGELRTAIELVGSPVKAEGVEDLLWIVAMLPEFELIR
jgi:hypothetical protein